MTISSNPLSNGILLCITSLVPDPLTYFKGEALGTRILWACFFGELELKKSTVRSMGWRISFSFFIYLILGLRSALSSSRHWPCVRTLSFNLTRGGRVLPVIAFRERLASSAQNGYLFQGW